MNKRQIFINGSKTYFWSSIFFERGVREDVFTFYAFVRVADDFVDQVPQDRDGFFAYRRAYERSKSTQTDVPIINEFKALKHRLSIPDEWIEAFFDSMQSDLHTSDYKTLGQLDRYMYGSAEIIGLVMNRIMGVDEKHDESAQHLGRAMQIINFVRDIQEDVDLRRTYVPEELRHGLADMKEQSARERPHAFKAAVHSMLAEYEKSMKKAQEGLDALPRRCRIPVASAAEIYDWTARKIRKDPFVVYRKKIKPSKLRVLWQVIRQSFK